MARIIGSCFFFAALVATLIGKVHGQASDPPKYTVITVEKMHCKGCAQRIANKLYEVPGVDKLQYDLEKKLFWVHPKTGTQPSPRGLWEAVEKADDRPTKLHGPIGVFTTKPQS